MSSRMQWLCGVAVSVSAVVCGSARAAGVDDGSAAIPAGTSGAAQAATTDATEAASVDSPCLPDGEGKDLRCGHAAAQIARLQMEQSLPPRRLESAAATDITHCRLEIEIDPVAQIVSGSNTIDVTAKSDGLTQMTLDLQSNMTVDSITVNGTTASYTRPTDQILITLDKAYNTGEAFQLVVAYHGTPQTTGFDSFTFLTHGSPAKSIVSSLSEPWGAHTWWPCKEDLTDKFTSETWVTVPDWMIVASNGLLKGTDTLSGSRKRYRWQEDYPIDTYLVSVAATNYTTWTDTYTYAGGSMPVQFFAYPEDVTSVQPYMANVVPAITAFSQPGVFGQYPFLNEKYGIAEFPWNGGMEHQTMTSESGGAMRSEWINVHELSHQWWGDMITCKTWHDIWLNEGFATFAEAVWSEKKPGGSMAAYRSTMDGNRPTSGSLGGTVYCYDATSIGRVFDGNLSYNKGGWVLHQLRHVIGDPAFWNTLGAYRAAFEGGVADTEDFRAIAEGVSGTDLSWFFNEWVYQGGAPSYVYGWQQQQIGSQRWVRLIVDQNQNTLYGYPLFTMPIDIKLNYASGSDTRVVWNQGVTRQWFLLPASNTVSSVAMDPDHWILSNGVTTETYVNGPPKVIHTVPDPGTMFDPAASISSVQIQFSEPIAYSASDFAVSGSQTGAASFNLSYSSADYTATLTFAQPLPSGQMYTVSVADAVHSTAANAALDGEIAQPNGPASLPSGDGLPGGSAVFTFSVVSTGDLDQDGDVDSTDLGMFRACFTGPDIAGPPDGCTQARFDASDIDGDSDVDMEDFGMFQRCFSGWGAPAMVNCAG